jgi:uncharacterized protein (TIGR02996 family)
MRVLAALDAIDDPRYRSTILRAADFFADQNAKPSKRARIEKLVATATAIRKRPTPRTFEVLPEIEAELARDVDPDQLLEAIYANPEDTAARLVYADVLQELGDPRGEFIAMQCTDTLSKKRERKLLAAHQRAWLGPLHPYLRDVTFERGFPTIATLRKFNFTTTPRDREWQLLEQLDVDRAYGVSLTELVQSMRSLRRLARFYGGDFQLLTKPLPWTSLGVLGGDRAFAKAFTANHKTVLPHLEELDLTACSIPSNTILGLDDLSALRVRVVATMQEHVNYLLERNATIVIVKQYALQLTGPHVTIKDRVATTNDQTFLESLKSIIPRSIKTSGTLPASKGRPAP